MKLEAFSKLDDGFPILNFRAEFCWKTASSISFALCIRPAPKVRRVFGWLDVHETSDEWRRVKMRICLDHKYVKFDECQTVINRICEELEIRRDSYEATFISPLKQISYDTGLVEEFVSYGPSYKPGDNSWDDRDGVSPLDIISREKALGMVLSAFPDFRREMDGVAVSEVSKIIGEQFLGSCEVSALTRSIENALKENGHDALRRMFEVLEKLVVFDDEYTRNASLKGLFEDWHRTALGGNWSFTCFLRRSKCGR